MPLTTLEEALAYYIERAKGVEGRSDKTIRSKTIPVRQLLLYLGGDIDLAELKEAHLIGFFGWLRRRPKWQNHPSGNKPQAKGLEDVSINTYYRGLRAFFNWLVKHKVIQISPMVDIEEPTFLEKLPRNLKPDQVEKVLRAINRKTYAGARDTAIIVLICDIAIRASEVVTLTLQAVELNELRVTRDKTNREDVLPFHKRTAGLLLSYRREWRPLSAHDEFFLTEDGRPLTTGRLWKILNARGKAAGIHLAPQLGRHTAAIRKRRDEHWDGERIQNLLGHKTPKTTRLYIRAAGDEDLREAFRKPGWVDRLKF